MISKRESPAPPLPAGFGVVLDPGVKQVDEETLFGGAPARVMRLSAAGRGALAELRAGPVRSAAAGTLARRLTDAGLAHPRPPVVTSRPDVTVLIPVRDRAVLLDRCLAALGRDYPVIVVDDGSADPAAIAGVAAAHGATLIRRPASGGPGAARNTGLASVTTALVAFLDSDCVPGPRWIERLAAHFADPAVAAAAPRMVAVPAGGSWAARYTTASCCLDLGSTEARVIPGTRVAYVPTAALLIRKSVLAREGDAPEPALAWAAGTPPRPPSALGWPGMTSLTQPSALGWLERTPPRHPPSDPPARRGHACAAPPRTGEPTGDDGPFDPGLRWGEDVDLVWRLHAAGWRIRYDPAVQVSHHEPETWPALLARRFRYGTSAAPLAARHPGQVPPLVLYPWPALTVAGLAGGLPGVAVLGFTGSVLAMRRALRRARLPARGVVPAMADASRQTWLGTGRYGCQFWAPVLAAAILAPGRGGRARRWARRAGAASLLLGPPLTAWSSRRGQLDPVRYVLGHLADDVAYGAGVWAGALRARSAAPVRPVIAWHPLRGDVTRRPDGGGPRDGAGRASRGDQEAVRPRR